MAQSPKLSRQVSDLRLETQFLQSSTEHVIPLAGQAPVRERWSSHDQKPVLGQGSYGIVRLEQSESDPSNLRAVKQIKKSDTNGNVIDYTRELEAIVKFSKCEFQHRFVCSRGWFEDGTSIFIVMEYLKNGDLNHYIKDPIPETEAQDIIRQILEGLSHMHDQGYIHRDLKPGNIMVAVTGPAWKVKIADFGVSKERHLTSITPNTFYVGTLGYAAPEQLAVGKLPDSPVHGNEADLWSVGIITFRILTGELPFLDTQTLSKYTFGKVQLPVAQLDSVNVSRNAERFIRRLLVFQPHERMLANASLSHPWIASRTASEQFQLTLRYIDSIHSRSSLPLSQLSEMPSARWSDVWDTTPSRLDPGVLQYEDQGGQPHLQQRQSPSPLHIHESSQSPQSKPAHESARSSPSPLPLASLPPPQEPLPQAMTDHAGKADLLKKHLRSAQIDVAKKLHNTQNYKETVPLLKQLLGSYNDLDLKEKETVAELAAIAFTESTVPMEENQLYLDQNEQFRVVYVQLRLQTIDEYLKALNYERALVFLKQLLAMYQILVSEQQKIVVEMSAVAFIEAIVPIEEMEGYFDQNEQLRVTYERTRVKKVESWFGQDRFHDILKLLTSYQATMLPPWSPSQSSEYDNLDDEIQLRMRIAECLNLTNDAQEARSILENLLAFMASSHIQRAAVHLMLSETLSSTTYAGGDRQSKVLAKKHAKKAANLDMDSLGQASPATLKAVALVAKLSTSLGHADQEFWGQILSEVKFSQRVEELKRRRAGLGRNFRDTKAFLDCQIKMMDISKTNPDEAIRVALGYLRSNFSIQSHDFCGKCAEKYFRMNGFSWSAVTSPGWDFCEHDPRVRMIFSPLHFFAAAYHKHTLDPPPPCTEEISCILDMADKERILNHVIHYGGRGAREVTPITAIWVAALWGHPTVVALLMMEETTDPSIGIQSIHRLGFGNAVGISRSITISSVLERTSSDQLKMCLKSSPEKWASYPHWPWCFASDIILCTTLEKLGAGSGGTKIPWNFEAQGDQLKQGTGHSLLTILLAFPILRVRFPMARFQALQILLDNGADVNITGPKLHNTEPPTGLTSLNALALGLKNAISVLEHSIPKNSPVMPSYQAWDAKDWYILLEEIRVSVNMTHLIIKALPSSSAERWNDKYSDLLNFKRNSYWLQVTVEFFSFESKTRSVRKMDKLLHKIGKPKRPRMDNPPSPISLPERLGKTAVLGLAEGTDIHSFHTYKARCLLEDDIAEVLRELGWLDKDIAFDQAGPYYKYC